MHMRKTAIFPLPIWGRFQLIFFHWKSKKSAIFQLPVYLAYWPKKRATCWSFPPSLKLIRLSIAELQRCWCGYVTWPCDLDFWPFNLGQWSNMAGHIVNPSTKFEDPTAIRFWLMSYDVRDRPPLTMRLEPLRMRGKGKFFPNIWNPWP